MQTTRAPRVAQVDPQRIGAISGAIAINGLLLALLVAPMSAPVVVDAVRETFTVYVPPKVQPTPPPPKPERVRVTVEQPHTTPTPRQLTPHVDPPPLTDAQPQPGDVVVAHVEDHPVVDDGGTVGPPDDGKPMTGAHLEYASNPAPTYPRDALLHGDSGTVVLEVLVGVDGRPLEVTISRSSGHRDLDIAAKRQVLAHWTFKPAMRNGQPVQAIGLVPVEFSLQ
jgi:protein TonB